MKETIKSAFEQDLYRAQHLEQFMSDIANIRQELLKLETAVMTHDQMADSFDYCDAKTAKFEEVERVRYIRTLIADLQAAF
jgi:hypothetical protein